MERERLGSRLGFILLSAGCAIGCGNVWKFPWMCGQSGGGAFVLIYLFFLVLLGLPVMAMEFSVGRAAQSSPVRMYHNLTPHKAWRAHGYVALAGNVLLMMFYTSVAGWILYYFFKSLNGSMIRKSAEQIDSIYTNMLGSPTVMVAVMAIVVVLGFLIISVGLQKGLERVTKYMMILLLALMLFLAIRSLTLSGAKDGLAFYLIPHFGKINISVVVGAMNQAFFTLSLGIGAMAILGSYIGKEHSLLGESVHVIILDTVVAIVAGLIIFPACFTFDIPTTAGPDLLFKTMARVFGTMQGGRWWGALFFLFMFFAAMSTVLAVFENILACVSEMTGFGRKMTSLICCVGMLILCVPCALGFNLWSGFHPLKAGSNIMDLEDFLVTNCLLPLGSLVLVLFCTRRSGWGFDNFMAEANSGSGLKVQKWMRFYMAYILPLIIIVVFVLGLVDYFG